MSLRLGKYELVSRLASGGMAETFRARLEGAAGVTKQVVIKKVLPSLAGDAEFIAAFIDEARLSAGLSHGNIAQVFEFGQVDGDYFLAMEWVDGRSLAQILRRTRELQIAFLPPSIACFLAVEVLKALHYAHTRLGEDGQPLNIVHRDVSPENILVSFEGQAKVIDFGIAKAALPRTQETAPGLVKGKFLYFSPEQAGGRTVDGRSDVFSLGVVLYELLCGAMPFRGQMHVVIQAILQGRFTPVQQVVSFEGQAKVIDFGIAKAALPRTQETAPGLVKGKFLYFSPEQAGGRTVDGRSDVFSLGVVLYELLCGAMPFRGQMHVVIQAILQGRFTPVQQVNPLLPTRLAEVVARAMAKDVAQRYGSALEMQQALTQLLYREDPTFSSETVKDWMKSLFAGPGAGFPEEELPTAPAASPAPADPRGSTGVPTASARAAAPAPADPSGASTVPARAADPRGSADGPATSSGRGASPDPDGAALPAPPAAEPGTLTPSPPVTALRIAIGAALALLVVAGFTIAALLAEPEPIDRPLERAPALAKPPVFAAPKPVVATPVDTLVYPAAAVVHAPRHRLRFDGLTLPTVAFPAGATPQLVERGASDEDSPLFFRARSTDPAHDGALSLVLQRPLPLPPSSGGLLFDFRPFEAPLRGATRKIEVGVPPAQLEFTDAIAVIDVHAAGWLTMENVPPDEKVKLTLRALDPKAWAGRPRGASVLVVWKRAFGRLLPPPGGDWPDELDRAVLTADRPLVVEHATALAFAFADPLATAEADSVLVEVFGTGEPASRPDPAAIARAARQHLEKGPAKSLTPTSRRRAIPKTIDLSGPGADVVYDEGLTLFEQGRFAQARVKLDRCLVLAPNDFECHKLLGAVLGQLGEAKKAMDAFREYLRLAPAGDPDVPKVRALIDQVNQ